MQSPSTVLERARAAVASLRAAVVPPVRNDRERDGAIQRFEYTFEALWKVAARLLAAEGVHVYTPRAVFRELARQELIEAPQRWLAYLDLRNDSSHTYVEAVAERVFAAIDAFLGDAEALLAALEARLHE